MEVFEVVWLNKVRGQAEVLTVACEMLVMR